jgi:predicted dehydrogenase
MACPAPMPRFIVEFERGGVRVEHLVQGYPKKKAERQGIVKYFPNPKEPWRTNQEVVPYEKADWVSYYRNIGDALLGKAPLAVKPEQALKHVAINEAAYKSARTGKAEPLPRGIF